MKMNRQIYLFKRRLLQRRVSRGCWMRNLRSHRVRRNEYLKITIHGVLNKIMKIKFVAPRTATDKQFEKLTSHAKTGVFKNQTIQNVLKMCRYVKSTGLLLIFKILM